MKLRPTHIFSMLALSQTLVLPMGVPGKPKIDLSEDVVCKTLPSIKLITAQKLNLKKFPIVSLDIYPPIET